MQMRAGAIRRWALLILAGGAIMGISLGIRQSQGLFMLPVSMGMNWSIEEVGFAFALQNLVWGLTQPLTGMLADRYGSAKVIFGGIMLYVAGLVAMAYSPNIIIFYLDTGLLIGAGLAGTAFGVVYGAVNKIVPDADRAWAVALVGAVGGFVQFLIVPFVNQLLNQYAWTGTLIALAIVFLIVSPLSLCLKTSKLAPNPAGNEISMSGALSQAFSHSGFWLLNLGFMACGFQLAFLAGHMPSYLVDQGLTLEEGGATIAIISLANVVGTFVFGYVGGSIFRRKSALSFLYVCRSVAMLLFVMLPLTTASTYIFATAMGFLWLGTVPLTSGLVGQIFGTKYLTTLFGFVFFGHQLGAFLGIWLAGYVFDTTGSYDLIWTVCIGMGFVAALAHLPINDKLVYSPNSLESYAR
ncbi:MFS transporter [Breoghania sp.]|uniref:MFS transporter n=1 Tax=Breoghania sp. TaxID=2065378 RepID=UPI0029CA2A16|nr:MFS transporter [Breoghania sp.]